MGKSEEPKSKPREGGICPWAMEAAIASGKPWAKETVQCDPDCMKFGHYYPDGRLDKAVGCTRRS